MKRSVLLAFTGLAIGFALPSVAQPQGTEADSQVTQKVRAVSKAFDEAVNFHNAAALGALFTEDAVL
jgi:hypothetical protein